MKKILILILTLLFLNILVVYAQDIDIGSEAIDRNTSLTSGYTDIFPTNPANASGTITSIEIWAYQDMTGLKVGTVYNVSGNNFTTRDYETIGNVKAGSKQIFEVDIEVETGDYLVTYYDSGAIEVSDIGEKGYYKFGDYIPCTDTTFSETTSEYTASLYGEGYTPGIKFNTITISKWNTTEISKWNESE